MPMTATDAKATVLRERNARLRDLLVSRGYIVVLPPDEDEADLSHAAEKADFTEER